MISDTLSELELRLEKTEAFLKHTSDGMCVLNADMQVIEVNEQFCSLLGWQEDDLMGQTPEAWDARFSPAELVVLVAQIHEGGKRVEFETIHRRLDGREFPVAVSAMPFIHAGKSMLMCLTRDISHQKRLEADLLDALEQVRVQSRAKSDFLSVMSHELRTPLNAICGFAEMMQHQVLGALGDPRYLDYSGHIVDSARHLTSLVNDILDLSKIEANEMELHFSTVSVEPIARDAIALVSAQAAQPDRCIDLHIDAKADEIFADRRSLHQMLVNVLANADRHTPGDGCITVRVGQDTGGGVFIAIADEGEGIAAEDLPRITEPFIQGHEENRVASRRGSGLGLSICSRLMEMHGGALCIDSIRGEGTTVTLRFPQQKAMAVSA